jgi:hypothetical protein
MNPAGRFAASAVTRLGSTRRRKDGTAAAVVIRLDTQGRS